MADKHAPSTSVAGRADAELCFAYHDPATDDLDFFTDYFWYAIFTGDKSPRVWAAGFTCIGNPL